MGVDGHAWVEMGVRENGEYSAARIRHPSEGWGLVGTE